ncbi:MAG TPA: sodium:solute symporter [Luteibaculaceae bacterium]|nr:sodium:solute symporter [Luteibaculaceae bacterium]
MNGLDWLVLLATLGFIAAYGVWKTRGKNADADYFKGDKRVPWWAIGLSVMATQASAITFLSTPGQAFEDGMRFVQFYFGLPLAMIILCVGFLPRYMKLNVYTAYEFLEQRFDVKTRYLAAVLFLIQRGLAAGITIYAPAIILSSVLNWDLNLTIALTGLLVIAYTVGGGSAAVNQTQKQQMIVILVGMAIAFTTVLWALPSEVDFGTSMAIAGKMNRLNVVDFSFNLNDRYNFWSGITGGLFLALSYFGTDQSQVARYISGTSLTESRLGLLFNGMVKIPMQFGILLTGVLVYVFFLFNPAPIFFNESVVDKHRSDPTIQAQQKNYDVIHEKRQIALNRLTTAIKNEDQKLIDGQTHALKTLEKQEEQLREDVKAHLKKTDPKTETKDTDYVFLHFVLNFMPHGLIGLLLAVIFCAAMSSTSSEINALASTTAIDIFRWRSKLSSEQLVSRSKILTALWGLAAIGFAVGSSLFDNLIEAVNILGSLFYGTVLGIFLVAFYVKKIKGSAVFMAALIAECTVLLCFVAPNLARHMSALPGIQHALMEMGKVSFLWYNVLGCALVVALGWLFQSVHHTVKPAARNA